MSEEKKGTLPVEKQGFGDAQRSDESQLWPRDLSLSDGRDRDTEAFVRSKRKRINFGDIFENSLDQRKHGIASANGLAVPRKFQRLETIMPKVKGLRERLRDGENIICAEGYMWELERRGFVKSGAFTPEVVLGHTERVRALHEEYVLAGSDAVQAYTNYHSREKMKITGREEDVETLNLNSLKMAREVADQCGKLMAGRISSTTTFVPNDTESARRTREIFKVVMPAVVTLVIYSPDKTTDDVPVGQVLRTLEELGADVVGLNCGRGPATMLPLLKEARRVCKGTLAALPVSFRTSDREKTFQSLTDPLTGEHLYPLDLTCVQCSRSEIRKFAQEATDIGIQYIGLCCDTTSNRLRDVAEVYGRRPMASAFSPDLSKSRIYNKNAVGHSLKVRNHMLGNTVV